MASFRPGRWPTKAYEKLKEFKCETRLTWHLICITERGPGQHHISQYKLLVEGRAEGKANFNFAWNKTINSFAPRGDLHALLRWHPDMAREIAKFVITREEKAAAIADKRAKMNRAREELFAEGIAPEGTEVDPLS